MRPLYTIQELAHTLRLQPGTVRNKLSRGEDMPRSVLVGRRRLFPEDAVEAWLRDQEARQTIPPGEAQATDDPPKPVGRPRQDWQLDAAFKRSYACLSSPSSPVA